MNRSAVRRLRSSANGLLLGLALLCGVSVAACAQTPTAKLLSASDTVFVGTVVEVGAASFAGVPVSARTLIVAVETVLVKPPSIPLEPGGKVTVAVKDPTAFRRGTRATFFTTGWILGDGVALQEVGHQIAPAVGAAGDENARAALSRAQAQLADAELRARVAGADAIVVGRVIAVRPATMAAMGAAPAPISEHDPQWQEAVIAVETTIKGAAAEPEIVTRFPASMDIQWYAVPKLAEGQEGTFILSRDTSSGTPLALHGGVRVGAYTALEAGDVLPRAAADRVRALLQP